MRRKTKAQRILDYENEEDEEEEQKPDVFSNGAQKRRKMYPAKEKTEENISADTGLQKLDMKTSTLTVHQLLSLRRLIIYSLIRRRSSLPWSYACRGKWRT